MGLALEKTRFKAKLALKHVGHILSKLATLCKDYFKAEGYTSRCVKRKQQGSGRAPGASENYSKTAGVAA